MLIVKASQVLYAERLDTNYHCCESQEPVLSMFPAYTSLQLFLRFLQGLCRGFVEDGLVAIGSFFATTYARPRRTTASGR
jgi:hypothetical protein